MQAKFDVDEKVYVTAKVIEINATDEGIVYQLKAKTVNGSMILNIEEDELEKIPASDVEPEPTPEPDNNDGE